MAASTPMGKQTNKCINIKLHLALRDGIWFTRHNHPMPHQIIGASRPGVAATGPYRAAEHGRAPEPLRVSARAGFGPMAQTKTAMMPSICSPDATKPNLTRRQTMISGSIQSTHFPDAGLRMDLSIDARHPAVSRKCHASPFLPYGLPTSVK